MMKPFLHQVTIDKVRVFGFNKDEWRAALSEEIDLDQLPAYYGGTLTDADGNPKCPSKVYCPNINARRIFNSSFVKTPIADFLCFDLISQFNMGGEVPRSFYVTNSKPIPKVGMQTLDVGSGSKKKLEFDIETVSSILR